MPDYDNYCPVSMGTDVLADRWTPMIVRELLLGNTRFNDIARGLPGISRTLLVGRLKHLERKGVVELWPLPGGRGNEYRLTPAGEALRPIINALGKWAVQWLYHEFDANDVEANNLMWWMHRCVAVELLPPGRTVVQYDHTAPTRTTLWFVLDRGESSICTQHPGFDSDVIVTATTPHLAEVFAGICTWGKAVADGNVRIEGPPRLVRAVPRWFPPNGFAPDMSARHAQELAASS